LEDPLYTRQKTLKEKYPLDSFLKRPALREQERKLEELGLSYDPNDFPEALVPKE